MEFDVKKEIYSCLTDSMKKILYELKGKTLKYIECVPQNGFSLKNNRVFDSLRLNVGKKSIDMTNSIHAIPQTDEEKTNKELVMEYAWFECFMKEKETFKSTILNAKATKFLLNEKITEVIIVTDEISSPLGYYEKADRAILIKTDVALYSFIRNIYWEDSIYIRVGNTIEGIPTEKEVAEQYGDNISVKREYCFL